MLDRYEFFNSPDGSVNVKPFDKPMFAYNIDCRQITNELIVYIRDLYPGAFAALSSLYSSSERNKDYYMFKIVHRFIRCNFGENDTLSYDINQVGAMCFEEVRCPIRGECIYEGVICKPSLQSKLSSREEEIGRLLATGLSNIEAAEELGISICTIHRHIANIKARLHFKNTNQIISYFHEK